MATPTKVIREIDYTLRNVRAALDDLPSVLEDQQHGELSDSERLTLSMGWDNEVHCLRVILDPAYRAGQMTPEQQARYRELLRQLTEALPTIRQLGFATPQVSLAP